MSRCLIRCLMLTRRCHARWRLPWYASRWCKDDADDARFDAMSMRDVVADAMPILRWWWRLCHDAVRCHTPHATPLFAMMPMLADADAFACLFLLRCWRCSPGAELNYRLRLRWLFYAFSRLRLFHLFFHFRLFYLHFDYFYSIIFLLLLFFISSIMIISSSSFSSSFFISFDYFFISSDCHFSFRLIYDDVTLWCFYAWLFWWYFFFCWWLMPPLFLSFDIFHYFSLPDYFLIFFIDYYFDADIFRLRYFFFIILLFIFDIDYFAWCHFLILMPDIITPLLLLTLYYWFTDADYFSIFHFWWCYADISLRFVFYYWLFFFFFFSMLFIFIIYIADIVAWLFSIFIFRLLWLFLSMPLLLLIIIIIIWLSSLFDFFFISFVIIDWLSSSWDDAEFADAGAFRSV